MNKQILSILILATLVISGASRASANSVIGSVGTTINYQLSSNGKNYEATAPFAVRGGYRFHFADLFAEYSNVRSSTGTDMVSIAQSNQELLFWIRRSDPTAPNWKPFIALGAGAHLQTVTTRFGGQRESDPGAFEPVGAVATGIEIRILKMVELTFEGRATTAASYTPNPLFGFGGFLSFLF